MTFGEFRLVELVAVRQVGVFEVDLDLETVSYDSCKSDPEKG